MFPIGSSNMELRAIGCPQYRNDPESNDNQSNGGSSTVSIKTTQSGHRQASPIESTGINRSTSPQTEEVKDLGKGSHKAWSLFPGVPHQPQGGLHGNAESEIFPAPVFPATQLFLACASVFVTPLGQDFVLDPLKLNSPHTLFSGTVPTEILSARPGPVVFLDLGGPEKGRRHA